MFGEASVILFDTGLFPAALALAEIFEQETGHIRIGRWIGRPARQQVFRMHRIAVFRGGAQFCQQLELSAPRLDEAGLLRGIRPIAMLLIFTETIVACKALYLRRWAP